MPAAGLITQLESTPAGLSSAEAERRLRESGPADLRDHWVLSRSRVLFRQIKSPLLWLLIFAATISAVAREWRDAIIVLAIVLATVAIGYWREYRGRGISCCGLHC